ncbi:MAG TPA: SCE4755 family polysaccharide monooxygenase-like protein, partial [Polyangiales bacterium]|nr:SCE4755 family polysaccharide monooxygenase-like protein [Polyangiales bacterium]
MNGSIAATLTSAVLLCSAPVYAHFKQLQPASWLNEDELGAPQKGSPCGPGNSRPFIGDDVQPIPESGALTTFRAGETITVQLQETIYHPGYFRISIAETSAAEATTADFPDPALTDTENCHYDHAAVMTTPHGQVLGDGLFMASELSAENRSLMTQVKLPDKPCEHCALQVVQVMEGHPASSCFYF